MGTPTACAYATLTFGNYENLTILKTFQNNLLYYKTYIDDIFRFWIPPQDNPQTTWETFKTTLNNWGNLKWTLEVPSTKTNFLDLSLKITNNTITTSTFQKPMNLFLYIPTLSAHPPSCLKGLIIGEVKRYWIQNNPEGFQKIVTAFIKCLLARGHKLQDLLPLLQQAASIIDQQTSARATKQSPSNPLYIHWTHHPSNVHTSDIRKTYNATLSNQTGHDHMTIALSRPKNLRDTLSRAALIMPEHLNLDVLIQNLKNG